MELKKTFLIVTVALLSSALIHAMTTEQRRAKLARFNEMVQKTTIDKTNAERREWLDEFIPIKNALEAFLGVGQKQMAEMKIKEFKAEAGTATALVGNLQREFEDLEKASYEPAKQEFEDLVAKLKQPDGTEWQPFLAGAADPANRIPFERYVDQAITLYKGQFELVDRHPTLEEAEENTGKKTLKEKRNFVLARAMQYVRNLLEEANDKIEAIKLDENEALKADRKTDLYKAFDDVLELLQRARYESGIYKADGTFLDEIPDADDSDVYNDENQFGPNTFDFATQKGIIATDILKTAVWQTFVNKIYQLQLVVTKDDSAAQIADVGNKTKQDLYGTADADEIRAIDLDIAYQVGPALVDRLNIMRSMFNITDDKQMPKPTDGEEQAGTIVENFTTAFSNRATAVGAPAVPGAPVAPVNVKAEVDKVKDIYNYLGRFTISLTLADLALVTDAQPKTEQYTTSTRNALQQAKDYYLAGAAAMDAQVANDLKTAINDAIGDAGTDGTYKKLYADVGAKGWNRPADIDPIP